MHVKFTERAQNTLRLAQLAAKDLRHDYVGTEHLLLGLIEEKTSLACAVLIGLDCSLPGIESKIRSRFKQGVFDGVGKLLRNPELRRVVERSRVESSHMSHDYVGTEHLLLSLFHEHGTAVWQILIAEEITYEQVKRQIELSSGR